MGEENETVTINLKFIQIVEIGERLPKIPIAFFKEGGKPLLE